MNLQRMRNSIVTRVILAGFAILLIGSVTRYVALADFLREDLQKVVSAQQEALAAYVARDIDIKIIERQNMLKHLAATLPAELLQQPDRLRDWLAVRQEAQPLFSEGLFVTGIDGIALSDYPRRDALVGVNLRDRDYVQAALAGQVAIGRPIIGRVKPIPVLPMSAPIKDASGQVRAVLAGINELAAPGFLSLLQTTRIGKTGGFLLISPRDQLIVAATDAKLSFTPAPAVGINVLHDRAMTGFRGSGITVNAAGVESIAAFASVPSADWFVVARLSSDEAFASIGRMQQYLFRNSLILAGVLLLLVIGTMRYVFRPLNTSADNADRMTRGELPLEPLRIERDDEVGHLTAAFNRLLVKLVASQAELANIAYHDTLTGLPNRFLLVDRMKRALARVNRNHTRLAMLYMDLDGFKAINDTLGHDAGDEALIEVARRLNLIVRESDTVARVGGDEFVVVLSDLDAEPQTAAQAACAVAAKCLEAMAPPLSLKGELRTLGLSIGIATGDSQSNFDSLVHAADSAMYQAKQHGRGRYVMADPQHDPAS
jgi:diguanylate cyclase (GGDEF)-like protein